MCYLPLSGGTIKSNKCIDWARQFSNTKFGYVYLGLGNSLLPPNGPLQGNPMLECTGPLQGRVSQVSAWIANNYIKMVISLKK